MFKGYFEDVFEKLYERKIVMLTNFRTSKSYIIT